MPANDTSRSNVIATIAPSDAPADTPSVSGEASGLRSSAWNTTPDSASALPTSAAAITRGRRATKKICASVLLRVRNRSIEDRTQVDPRAAHERREQQRQRGERAKRGDRQGKTPADRRRVNAIGQSAPPSHGRARGWNCTSASTP